MFSIERKEDFFTFLWPPENLGMSRFRTSSFLLKSILFPKTRRERVKHVLLNDLTKKREREGEKIGGGKGGRREPEPVTLELRTKLRLARKKIIIWSFSHTRAPKNNSFPGSSKLTLYNDHLNPLKNIPHTLSLTLPLFFSRLRNYLAPLTALFLFCDQKKEEPKNERRSPL